MHKTDWFRGKKWGVFTHYLWLRQNNPERIHSQGLQTGWDACVNELDVELLARQLQGKRTRRRCANRRLPVPRRQY